MSNKSKSCFFEKKQQKTFAHWRASAAYRAPRGKSLFASFSSEKEDLNHAGARP